MTKRIGRRQRAGPYTFEDFCAIIREDEKADLINGVIYLAPPETPDANELFGWLVTVVNAYAHRTKQGRVFASRVAFRLAIDQGPEPDIVFVRTNRLVGHVKRNYVDAPPDLVMEIVSPDSIERDYCLKRTQYEEHGVSEYWIIDDWERKVTLLQWNQGKYRAARPKEGKLVSNVLWGFWLQPEWLWQEPRPDGVQLVMEMLAQQPRHHL